jgi:Holliday junction resolvase RusA-like endonuclease
MYSRTARGGIRKADGVEAYQAGVTYIARTSKPSGWKPSAQIRVIFDFFLKRDADCDNLMKSLLDSVAIALGVNDKVFLPCARSKTVGSKNPRTVVTIEILEDNPRTSVLVQS